MINNGQLGSFDIVPMIDENYISGVNFFMGKFYECIDVESGERYSHEQIPNRTVCEEVRLL